MAYANKIISYPHSGQQIKFLKTAKDTGGTLLEMESTYTAFSKEPPAHYHPSQEEDFTVISGEISIRMTGTVRVLRPGDQLHVPRNTVHSMWNSNDGPATVNWQVRPALDTEYFFETATGLASDGKVNKNGMPRLLQTAWLAHAFSHVFRLAKPPLAVQRLVFGLLTPFAYLAGYRPRYKKYLD